MAINKNDILGYLLVLNCPTVWNRLTADEQMAGRKAMLGCYCRLMESLECDVLTGESRFLYTAIQRREHLNIHLMLPVDDVSLRLASEQLANMLFEYIRGEFVSPTVVSRFLNEFDNSIATILENYGASINH